MAAAIGLPLEMTPGRYLGAGTWNLRPWSYSNDNLLDTDNDFLGLLLALPIH
jgi:hypothetical protein